MLSEKRLVVTVGGANGERVLRVEPAKFRLGTKHTMAPPKIVAGGSSVNHACRLLAMGIQVFPVLPIVNDGIGQVIAETLDASANVGNCTLDVENLYMEGNDLATPFTTILSVGTQRTVLNEFSDSLIKAFPKHCDNRLATFQRYGSQNRTDIKRADAVMIGHIHADRRDHPGLGGGISDSIIRGFHAEGIDVFTNFGSSQYRLGTTRWGFLLDRVKCFQLDIDEMREFCRDADLLMLEDMLNWFKDKCTVVITMERMGAVACLKGSESVVLAWPYDLKPGEIKDSTGAGDAFAAGIVASALERPLDSDEALCKALENGRLWGAYACTKLGGANECPTHQELDGFKSKHRLFLETECKSMDEARPMLRILDRVFLRQ